MSASKSLAPLPLLRAVRFALVALALGGVLLWSAPAQAQTTIVLVKNTGQTSGGAHTIDSNQATPCMPRRLPPAPTPLAIR